MNNRREILTGIIAALISIVILGGSLGLATIEGNSTVASYFVETSTPTSYPTKIIMVTQRPGEPTYTPSPTPSPSPTPTIIPPTTCPPPTGWSAIVVQPGDTLDSIAQTYNTTKKVLKEANCLIGNILVPGTIIYVPGVPPPTNIPCGPPPGWIYYIVKPGDTLYSIGRAHGVSVSQLQTANCMGSSTNIRVGQRLYVPNVPTVVPSLIPTLLVTPSPAPSASPTIAPPSLTPTFIPPTLTPIVPTLTPTIPLETVTETPIPTVTATEATTIPTLTETPIPVPSETPDIPTATSTAVPVLPTATPTLTPPPTNTPTLNPTR